MSIGATSPALPTPQPSNHMFQTTGLLPTYADNNKVMENGITYQVLSNPNPKGKVMIKVVLRVGSMQEEDQEQGFAHFVEHAAFLGTKSFSREEIKGYFQSIGLRAGADENAATSPISTEYYLTLPNDPDNIKKCLKILYEMIFEMKLLPEEIEKEKQVILDEKGRKVEWLVRFQRKMLRRLYPGQKFAERMPIGEEGCIKNANAENLRRFYEKWYRRTDLLGVFVVGDIDGSAVEEMLKDEFGKAPKGVGGEYSVPVPLQEVVSKISVVKDKAIKNPSFIMKQRMTMQGGFRLDALKEQLSYETVELLLKYRLKRTIDASPELNCNFQITRERSPYDPRMLIFSCSVAAENCEKIKAVVRVLFQELRRLRLHGVQEKEFTRTVKSLCDNYDLLKKGLSDQKHPHFMERLTYSFSKLPQSEDDDLYTAAIAIFKQLRIRDVIQKIKDYLLTQKSLFFLYLNEGDALSKTDIKEIIDVEDSRNDLTTWEDSKDIVITEPLRAPGGVVARQTSSSLEVTSIKLENGVEIRIRPLTCDSRTFYLEGRHPFFLGNMPSNDFRLLSTALAAFNLTGFAGVSYPELLEFYSRCVVQGSFPFLSFKGVIGRTPPEHREVLLKSLYQKLTSWNEINSGEFETQFEKKKQFGAASAKLEYADEQKVILQFYDLVTQGNPFFLPSKSEDFLQMTVSDARELFFGHFPDPSQWRFSLVGHVGEIEQILPLLCKYLGSMEKREAKKSSIFDYQVEVRENWGGVFKFYNLKKDRSITRILFEKKLEKFDFSLQGAELKKQNYDSKLTQCAQAVLKTYLTKKIRGEERLLYRLTLNSQTITMVEEASYRMTAEVNYVEFNCKPDEAYINVIISAVKEAIQSLDIKTVEELLSGEKEQMKIQKRDNDRTIPGWSTRLVNFGRSIEDLEEQINNYESSLDSITPLEVFERIKQDYHPNRVIIQSHYPESFNTAPNQRDS